MICPCEDIGVRLARNVQILIQVIGTDEWFLTGGALIDSVLYDARCSMDVDIVISPTIESGVMRTLESSGAIFRVWRRPYFIDTKSSIAHLYEIRLDDAAIDIAVLGDIELIGKFNAESMYYDVRAQTLVDKHGCAQSHRLGELRLIRAPEGEDLSMLMSRLFLLVAKYGFELKSPNEQEMLKEIAKSSKPITEAAQIDRVKRGLRRALERSRHLDKVREVLLRLLSSFPDLSSFRGLVEELIDTLDDPGLRKKATALAPAQRNVRSELLNTWSLDCPCHVGGGLLV